MGVKQLSEGLAEQSVHDRSVIDHVVNVFSNKAPAAQAPAHIHSPEIYHQIRRTWPVAGDRGLAAYTVGHRAGR